MNKEHTALVNWLYIIAAMVFIMVLIGGITRLTDSGLSMVDWKPIMGIIPPLSEAQWHHVFEQYKAFPEYKLINHNMDLEGFKSIYFWEYFHRVFGRLIGLAFFFPFIIFKFKKMIPKRINSNLVILFALGALQGLMGWYMVKSGLVNRPDVSHYRLAAHLGLAFVIIAYTLWTILQIRYPDRRISFAQKYKVPVVIFSILLIVQIIYGAFVAGLDAGLTHNTFPKMGRSFIASDISYLSFFSIGIFENPVVVQFIHRVLAWCLLGMGISLIFYTKWVSDYLQKRSIQYVLILLLVQFALGVATLVYYVPVTIASLHQVGACGLLLLCVRMLFFTFTKKYQ